jgi:hypothetical protein
MSSKRRVRRWEPTNGFDSLEARELMTAGGVTGLDGQYINKFDYNKLLAKRANPPAPPADRRVELPLPQYGPNAKAVITLYGPGTLISDPTLTKGTLAYEKVNTHVDPNGGLHILFNGTTSNSQIIGSVSGISKKIFPNINEIRDADVAKFDTTGVGTNQMGYVNMARFNLGPGGRVNLSAGVQRLFLNDIAHGTQLDLAALATPPITSPQNPGGFNTTTTTNNSGSTAVTNNTGQRTTSTTINGITITTVLPTTDQLTISNGELTGVGGIILPGSVPSTSGNVKLEVQGVELIVRNVNGRSNSPTPEPRLGNQYIAGLIDNDASATDQLIYYKINRNSDFVITSANAEKSIDVKRQDVANPAADITPLTMLGAGLGQYANGKIVMPTGTTVTGSVQVVAVGYSFLDTTTSTTRYFINAYSVVDGSLQGYFEVLENGLPDPFDGVGGASGDLFLTDSKGGTNGTGVTKSFDITESLDTKVSVPVYIIQTDPLATPVPSVFNYPVTFNAMPGTTGVAGISYIYNTGAAYFDAYSPLSTDPQLGIMKINDADDNSLSVNSTTKIGGSIPWLSNTQFDMGSVDQNVVLVNPSNYNITDGYYTAQMFSPNTLASTGSFKLYTTNQKLAGLSESFNPQLFGSSVIDVKGNLKTFSAKYTNNMVLNVNGIANLVQINQASNTEIIAHPILHVAVSWKPNSNVNILSSARPTDKTTGGKTRPGTRGGVQVVKNLPILGPFINPAQS